MRVPLAVALLLTFVTPGMAATIHVPEDQPTVQAGIDVAQAGDTVLVACGTYHEHDIVMKSGVWLRSKTGQPDCVVLDAGRLGRVISCTNIDAQTGIEGFTLSGGYLEGYAPESRGGGIALVRSSPRILNCAITDNEGQAGGGGVYVVGASPILERCLVGRNSGIDGGGIYMTSASPTIIDCTIHDNECSFWGGGIFCNSECTPTITGCTMARNSAYQGGGIWCVSDCRIQLENTIVAFSVEGEGVYAYLDYGHPSIVTLTCSDVYGNAGGEYGGTMEDQTGENGNISVDPLFCDAAAGDFGLYSGSPCLPEHNECGVLIGANGEACISAGIGDAPTGQGRAAWIEAVPNPCRGGTEIRLRLPGEVPVTLRIFDPRGRLVRQVPLEGASVPGSHSVRWDGRDDAGRLLASGVYLCRVDAGTQHESERIILLR